MQKLKTIPIMKSPDAPPPAPTPLDCFLLILPLFQKIASYFISLIVYSIVLHALKRVRTFSLSLTVITVKLLLQQIHVSEAYFLLPVRLSAPVPSFMCMNEYKANFHPHAVWILYISPGTLM